MTNNSNGIAETMKKWFDIPENHNWLIVFNNYDDKVLFLQNYILSNLSRIIITGRIYLGSISKPIEIGTLNIDKTKTLLCQSFPEDKIWIVDERIPPYYREVKSTCLRAGK